MSEAIWWTGFVTLALLTAALEIFVIEVIIAVVATISWVRWSLAVMKKNGRKPHWGHLPKTFANRVVDLFLHRNNGRAVWNTRGGYWRGIGDWVAFKQVAREGIYPNTTNDRRIDNCFPCKEHP